MFIINPGTGPVENATASNARQNMAAFASALATLDHEVGWQKIASSTDNDGRWSYALYVDGVRHEVEMPGAALDVLDGRTRYWPRPRLYIDGSSWWWEIGLSLLDERACPRDPDGQHFIGCGCDT